MAQPKWKYLQNLGDVNPVEYGGAFLYQDTTGVYSEELEVLFSPDSDEGKEWVVYRFPLDRLKIAEDSGSLYLIPTHYDATWPHPIHKYDAWFHDDLARVADSLGRDVTDLRADFCSPDPVTRAFAYQAIGDYHGYVNLDEYPRTFHKRSEVTKRYRNELRHGRAHTMRN